MIRRQLPSNRRQSRAAGGATPAWDPTDLAGLALWLDASDISTLSQDTGGSTPVTTSGDPVGRWADKSGNSRHLTQATAGRRPTYQAAGRDTGQPALSLDDIDDGLTRATGHVPPGALTLALVGKITSTPGGAEYDQFFACGDGTTWVSVLLSGDASYSGVAFARGTVGTPAGVKATSASIATGKTSTLLIYDGAGTAPSDWSAEHPISTSQSLSASSIFGSPGTGIFIGDRATSAFPSGYSYSEVILVEGALSGADLTSLRNYLAAKWT